MKLRSGGWRRAVLGAAVGGALSLGATAAWADLIFMGPALIQPAGLGVVPTILTLQSKGKATDETAITLWDGTDSVTMSLVNPAGAAQPGVDTTQITGGANNQARTLEDLGVTTAAGLRIFFNINENNQLDVLLRELVVTAYDAAGASVFTAALAAPMMLVEIGSGLGTSDYVFGLTADEAAELQAVFSPTLRIGLQASISNAEGGPESFFGGNAEGNPVQVPEPRSLALLGVGLLGIAALVRRRKFKV